MLCTWRYQRKWRCIWDQPTTSQAVEIGEALQWRHNGHDSVSNHQLYDSLLNRLFRRRSKKTLKLRVTGLCGGNSPGSGEFPAQMASNAENVSIWWRHHEDRWMITRHSFLGQCSKLEQFAVPETCGNWLGLVNSCIKYARQTHDIYLVLPYSVDFKAPSELWNPLRKAVLNQCSFIWNKGPINIWNDRKAQK